MIGKAFVPCVIVSGMMGSLATIPGSVSPPQGEITISVDLSHPGPAINPAMWGIFFEDINFAADGGLNAELVKNRSFEFDKPLMGWTVDGKGQRDTSEIRTDAPLNPANPHYLRIHALPGMTLENEGFRGMGVRAGERYLFQAFSRQVAGQRPPSAIRLELVAPDGTILGSARIGQFVKSWAPIRASLTCSVTQAKAHFRLTFESAGQLDLDMVSLYPEHTWRDRPMGLRADLVQRLADLHPGFVRFPGGCIVEGRYLSTRYQWKKTIGRQEERHAIINRWNTEFRHKPAPDYFQSFGLGFMEYFQLCEDIGAEPLPVLNCGMACQFNSKELAPLDQLDPYIQDALDLIEFANGPVTSRWGARRAALGHPKPFRMKLIGVGNEQWGPDYFPRYERFARAIKSKYPDIQIVSGAGPSPSGKDFDLAWSRLRAMDPKMVDIVDEHNYAAPEWFFDNTHRYDLYPRTGPKVFMGEYAAQSVGIARPDNQNNWQCALSEAAYMIGLERNADVVRMSSYAPLFANVDAWQWTPDLIWFDNLRSYATPNYYVQQMFMRSRGERVQPVRLSSTPTDEQGRSRFYVSAVSTSGEEAILKIVNGTGRPVTARIDLGRAEVKLNQRVTITEITGSPGDVNSLESPSRLSPKTRLIIPGGGPLNLTFPARSFTTVRIPVILKG